MNKTIIKGEYKTATLIKHHLAGCFPSRACPVYMWNQWNSRDTDISAAEEEISSGGFCPLYEHSPINTTLAGFYEEWTAIRTISDGICACWSVRANGVRSVLRWSSTGRFGVCISAVAGSGNRLYPSATLALITHFLISGAETLQQDGL